MQVRNDAVFISVSYRSGFLGHWAHQELAKEDCLQDLGQLLQQADEWKHEDPDGSTGNYEALDQRHWPIPGFSDEIFPTWVPLVDAFVLMHSCQCVEFTSTRAVSCVCLFLDSAFCGPACARARACVCVCVCPPDSYPVFASFSLLFALLALHSIVRRPHLHSSNHQASNCLLLYRLALQWLLGYARWRH